MRSLAAFIMRGPLQAIAVVVACAVLSLLLQPLQYLGAGAVALVTLRLGARQGAMVVAGSLAAAALAGFLLTAGDVTRVLVLLVALWGGVWLLALVLRMTVSLSLALQAGALLVAFGVLLLYVVTGDAVAFWRSLLESAFDALMHHPGGPELEPLRAMLMAWTPLMSGLVAAGGLLSLTVGLLLGRWWQSLLYNPGGFRTEFRALRLDRRMAAAVLVLLGAGAFAEGGIGLFAANLVLPLMMAFLLAGLALIHAFMGRVRNAQFWLTGFYVLLVVVQPLMLFVVLAALADSWLNFRSRAGRPV